METRPLKSFVLAHMLYIAGSKDETAKSGLRDVITTYLWVATHTLQTVMQSYQDANYFLRNGRHPLKDRDLAKKNGRDVNEIKHTWFIGLCEVSDEIK